MMRAQLLIIGVAARGLDRTNSGQSVIISAGLIEVLIIDPSYHCATMPTAGDATIIRSAKNLNSVLFGLLALIQ